MRARSAMGAGARLQPVAYQWSRFDGRADDENDVVGGHNDGSNVDGDELAGRGGTRYRRYSSMAGDQSAMRTGGQLSGFGR